MKFVQLDHNSMYTGIANAYGFVDNHGVAHWALPSLHPTRKEKKWCSMFEMCR